MVVALLPPALMDKQLTCPVLAAAHLQLYSSARSSAGGKEEEECP